MGSPPDEPERDKNETQHRVRITKPFWLGETEVTQGLWKAVMGSSLSGFKDCGDICPANNVSWNECQKFIRKLNTMFSGASFRLPTEAQWEYACRAGTTTPFNTGRCLGSDQASYGANHPYSGCSKGHYSERMFKAGSFAPNAWGLYDMHGNVMEWCNDWYGDYPAGTVTDPAGPSGGSDRVLRGGSYCWHASDCRSAKREKHDPVTRSYGSNLGLRLAMTKIEGTTAGEQKPSGGKGRLTVIAEPDDARIRILNNGPAYKPGMELDPGRYHVEVSANGYETWDDWVVIDSGAEKGVKVELKPVVTAPTEDKTLTVKGVSFKMVRIPSGIFMMGSPDDAVHSYDCEPYHRVQITKDFWLGQTEVTQGLWKAVMGSNPSHFSNCGDDCPVENVSWNDCQEFIRKLNGMLSGGNFRLPTEAEWEYACRAGTTTQFSFGRCLTTDQENYRPVGPWEGCPDGKNRGRTIKVGSLIPNSWGLYDMHGNVEEWCQDWYERYPKGSVDPTGPSKGSHRVKRGGSWTTNLYGCGCATRIGEQPPDRRADYLGLRLARTDVATGPDKSDKSKMTDPLAQALSAVEDKGKAKPSNESKISPSDLIDQAISKVESKVKTEKDSRVPKTSHQSETSGEGRGSSGEGGTERGITMRMYQLAAEEQIKSNWSYPVNVLDPRKWKGLQAIVVVKVQQDGTILKSWFTERSASPIFDGSVLKAIERSDPLPPFPEGYKKRTDEIEIKFDLSEMEAS